MPSEKDFRRIALGLDGALESSHMGHPDFRAHGRIFVTLQHDRAWGGLMLTPEQQTRFIKDCPDSFKPAAGAWGVAGATLVHLPSVDEEALGEAITMSWTNAKLKTQNPKRRTKTRTKKAKR
jgi:hypothetical protein